jgi:hypothetical protein
VGEGGCTASVGAKGVGWVQVKKRRGSKHQAKFRERVRRCTNGSSVAATGTRPTFGEEAGKEGARLSRRIGRRASKQTGKLPCTSVRSESRFSAPYHWTGAGESRAMGA